VGAAAGQAGPARGREVLHPAHSVSMDILARIID
jgi:hypothetical protein